MFAAASTVSAMATGPESSESLTSTVTQSLENLGEHPNQPILPSFHKRKFGVKSPVFRSFQSSWYNRWPWIHYDQVNDCAFCFTCLKAKRLGI